MSDELAPLSPLSEGMVMGSTSLPALIVRTGRSAAERFLEFFTAQIRDQNTRAAYARAVGRFL